MKSKTLEKFKRFIKHRERMMVKFGARMTIEKMTIISKLINICEYNKNANELTVCRVILLQEDKIKEILLGRTSSFYESDNTTIDDIFNKCKQTINQIK